MVHLANLNWFLPVKRALSCVVLRNSVHLNYIVPALKALCGPEEYPALPQLWDGILLTHLNYIVPVLKALCGPEEYLALPQLWDGDGEVPAPVNQL